MTSDPKKPATAGEQRQARLEKELRANLMKRKALARARREERKIDDSGETGPATPLPHGPRSD